MVLSDTDVKTALITMYIIGIICLGIIFFLLDHINGQFFTKFSIGLIGIVLVMGVILVNLFSLS
ncbi:hypothetical protein FEZ41_13655 [Lentilactobacillus parafarraginis]|jgi:uncharacterized protein (DUF983 family)|uniref:Uncharacterized protein n=3 Tax=Lentilactobacillus parafarraginis TaxID=390842 RepID=A0A0R1YCS2_9LACO|nr:hypothetical protein [Lentilactobacillus parafarraginis]EHL98213.1 hypothetical protein HMPREF9103_01706 [Lentilactobacillus parafarraginis F0439]KRM38756.1 hypothetical protein FD47_GL000295 [Lentilactobacillus parafarraginis DSM 18390 = JCM 14109]TLQ15783.1 hypothetical protein FEZ41_13655 [Lentilactobacillus parafarraginis]